MFFSRRMRTPIIRGESTGEQIMRGLLLLGVLALVIWGFWANSERTMTRIAARGTVFDQGKFLTKEQKQSLGELAAMFKQEFGLSVKIHLRADTVELPDLDAKTIFIGLNPNTKQVMVELPPLLKKALGDDYQYTLQNEHFPPYLASGEWRQGLILALTQLWEALSGAPLPKQ
ncbi:MAG: TPM domain-containing protein [Desulfovibrionaceae bacterium]